MRRILYDRQHYPFHVTVTKPSGKSDIIVTIEDFAGNCADLQTDAARSLLDALRMALGES